MGRSVCVPSGAKAVIYLDCSELSDDEWAWDDLLCDLRSIIQERYPSFEDINDWVGHEYLAILKNAHGMVIVSEYMGLVSVSLGCNPDAEQPELSVGWCESVAYNFEKLVNKAYGENALTKLGTFSNGGSVYKRIGV